MKKYRYSAIIWLAAALMAGAKTIYVATNGDDARTGQTDWTNAVLTISNGVAKATAVNDLVLVSNGEYGVSAQIDVAKQITVRSWNNGIVDPTNTIINGNASVKGFYISHTGAVVEGFTIFNGAVGVQIWDGGTLRNCIVVSNVSAGAGGGIYLRRSGCLVEDCVIAHNTAATQGGGIYFYSTSKGTIRNCIIRNNTANYSGAYGGGGGVYMNDSNTVIEHCHVFQNEAVNGGGGGVAGQPTTSPVIKDCFISNNLAATGGGGIWLYTAGLVTNCLVCSNECVSFGGGIYARYGIVVANSKIVGNKVNGLSDSASGGGVYMRGENAGAMLVNSEIRDNYGANSGGGAYLSGGSAMRNCLVVGNTATNTGGGLALPDVSTVDNCTIVSNQLVNGAEGGGVYVGYTINYLANCIIYYNSVPVGGLHSNYYNIGAGGGNGSYSNCCFAPVLSGAGSIVLSTNNITEDPQFVDMDAGNWRLSKNSQCINAGAYRAWMQNASDLDARVRIREGIVDIGAYEYIRELTMFMVR